MPPARRDSALPVQDQGTQHTSQVGRHGAKNLADFLVFFLYSLLVSPYVRHNFLKVWQVSIPMLLSEHTCSNRKRILNQSNVINPCLIYFLCQALSSIRMTSCSKLKMLLTSQVSPWCRVAPPSPSVLTKIFVQMREQHGLQNPRGHDEYKVGFNTIYREASFFTDVRVTNWRPRYY